TRAHEHAVALSKPFGIGSIDIAGRQRQGRTVEPLEEIKHRAVILLEESTRYANDVVGRDPDKMLVERAMVNRTEAQPVGYRGCALDQCVPSDVGGIEKAHLSQSADSAAVPVRRQYDCAKATLVQTYFDLPC